MALVKLLHVHVAVKRATQQTVNVPVHLRRMGLGAKREQVRRGWESSRRFKALRESEQATDGYTTISDLPGTRIGRSFESARLKSPTINSQQSHLYYVIACGCRLSDFLGFHIVGRIT